MGCGHIHEGICKCGDTTDNAVLWGYHRVRDGLVAEFHRIKDLLGLGVVWYDPLALIMI